MIYAICIDCDHEVMVDDEEAFLNINNELECCCPGDARCKGDDYTEDHRLDDPRHEPYSNLRSK